MCDSCNKGISLWGKKWEKKRGGESEITGQTHLLGETPERNELFCHNKRTTGAGWQTWNLILLLLLFIFCVCVFKMFMYSRVRKKKRRILISGLKPLWYKCYGIVKLKDASSEWINKVRAHEKDRWTSLYRCICQCSGWFSCAPRVPLWVATSRAAMVMYCDVCIS